MSDLWVAAGLLVYAALLFEIALHERRRRP